MKLRTALLAIVAALAVPCAASAQVITPFSQQVTPAISQQGTLASNTPTLPMILNGQSSCGIALYGSGSATIVPQGTSDVNAQPNGFTQATVSWNTATGIGSGSISYAGTSMSIPPGAPGGTIAFRLSPGTVTGTVSYVVSCNGSTSAATPNAQNSSGFTTPVQCDQFAFSLSGAGQIITASGSTKIYVCSVAATAYGTAPSVYGKYGTGTQCATGGVNMFDFYAATSLDLTWGTGVGALFTIPAGQNFCYGDGGTVTNMAITVTYAQF